MFATLYVYVYFQISFSDNKLKSVLLEVSKNESLITNITSKKAKRMSKSPIFSKQLGLLYHVGEGGRQ